MKYKDFKTSLEFLINYGFTYCKDSATGRADCYKNEFGEIVLRYKELDPNYWVPEICVEINFWKTVIDIDKEYKKIRLIKLKKTYDMLHDIAQHNIKTTGKLFGILIHPDYLNNNMN